MVSHNGVVLIVGQVPDERLKTRATQIASEASDKIKRIHNELEIAMKSQVYWISAVMRGFLPK